MGWVTARRPPTRGVWCKGREAEKEMRGDGKNRRMEEGREDEKGEGKEVWEMRRQAAE